VPAALGTGRDKISDETGGILKVVELERWELTGPRQPERNPSYLISHCGVRQNRQRRSVQSV
jgi:hypothetical protein